MFLVGVVARAVVRGLGWWWALGSLEMGLQAFSSRGLSLVLALLFLRWGCGPRMQGFFTASDSPLVEDWREGGREGENGNFHFENSLKRKNTHWPLFKNN